MTRIEAIGGWLLIFAVSGLAILATVKTDLRLQYEAEAQVTNVLADFGGKGRIVEIYGFPTGNRATGRIYTLAIVENERGDRLRVDVGEKLAVTGDIWTIERNTDGGNSYCDRTALVPGKLILGKLIRKG